MGVGPAAVGVGTAAVGAGVGVGGVDAPRGKAGGSPITEGAGTGEGVDSTPKSRPSPEGAEPVSDRSEGGG